MTSRIIFQDIDGPLIPLRMYFHGGRWYDAVNKTFVFDPIAVQMVNAICRQTGAQVVFNTAHNINSAEIMLHQAKLNGLNYMHEDCQTKFSQPMSDVDRLGGCKEWLSRHPEVTGWCVIDDFNLNHPKQVLVDYNIGMTIENFGRAHHILTGEPWKQPVFISQADKID